MTRKGINGSGNCGNVSSVEGGMIGCICSKDDITDDVTVVVVCKSSSVVEGLSE